MNAQSVPFRSSLAFRAAFRAGYADRAAVLLLVGLTVASAWRMVVGGTAVGIDASNYFYPMYSFLGERLRSGDIPMWNPRSLSGAPFAADPQSGWTYLPAMLLFTLLPISAAAKSFMLGHLLLAGLGVYALARALRMTVAGALAAAVAYEFSGFLYERTVCCWAFTMVSAWVPFSILCTEMAIRSGSRLARALWWGGAGFALSQILAAWLGQGAYYALLILGSYVAYRTLLAPPLAASGMRARLAALALHGGAVLLIGAGLAAAGLLPRLEYTLLSNLAEGYPIEGAANLGGWRLLFWSRLVQSGIIGGWYVGGAALALALAAPFVARSRHAVPLWACVSVCALVLSGQGPTPLHSLLYLLPMFGNLHSHYPERVMMIFYLSTALLAGATVSCLPRLGRRGALLMAAPLATTAGLIVLNMLLPHAVVSRQTLVAMLLAAALMGACVLLPPRRSILSGILVLVVFGDLLTSGRVLAEHGLGQFKKVDLEAYYRPTGTAGFLLSRQRAAPFRYFGYDPRMRRRPTAYRFAWFGRTNIRAIAIGVNNRATMLGLQDVQGYNPLHIARYDELVAAINGGIQEYHELNVLAPGLHSPLLDLLNVRYVLVPARTPDDPDLRRLRDAYPSVWRDAWSRVLQRPSALPRAWLVHHATVVRTGGALPLLASGSVDPRSRVLLEEEPPALAPRAPRARDGVQLTSHTPDSIAARTSSSAPAMLVLSEIYYPAWKAYVDGEPAPVHVANHAFRAVHVPAGEHMVEMRYESWTLRLGVAISALFYALLAALAAVALRRRARRSPPPLIVTPSRPLSQDPHRVPGGAHNS